MDRAILRRSPGAGSDVTAPERGEIQRAHRLEGLNRSALAAGFGCTRCIDVDVDGEARLCQAAW
jgi:hypothetical protein